MDDYVNDAIEYEDETQVRYHMTSLRAVVDYALERPHFEADGWSLLVTQDYRWGWCARHWMLELHPDHVKHFDDKFLRSPAAQPNTHPALLMYEREFYSEPKASNSLNYQAKTITSPPQPKQSTRQVQSILGNPALAYKFPSLRRLALACLADNLLLFDGLQDLPLQYRAPIFIFLLRQRKITLKHLQLLLTPEHKTLDLSFSAHLLTASEHSGLGRLCPYLTTLNIANAPLDTLGLQSIVSHAKGLQSVNISHCTGAQDIKCLESLKHLRVLNIAHCYNLKSGLSYVTKACQELEELDMSACFELSILNAMSAFHQCGNLKILKANEQVCRRVVSGDKFHGQPSAKKLEVLSIDQCGPWMPTSFLAQLILSAKSSLQVLSVASSTSPQMGYTLSKEIAAACFPKLHTLNMRGHVVSTKFLRNLPSLTALDVNDGCLSESALEDICAGTIGFSLSTFRWENLRVKRPKGEPPILPPMLRNKTKFYTRPEHGIAWFLRLFRSNAHPLSELELSSHKDMSSCLVLMDHEYPRDTDNGGCLKPVHLDWSRVKLAHQQHLTKLILKDLCWLTEQQVPCLLAACPKITYLDVSCCPSLSDRGIQLCLSNLPELQTFVMGGTRMTEKVFDIVSNERLEELHIVNSIATEDTIKSAFDAFPNLVKIAIIGNKYLTTAVVNLVENHRKLRHLTLGCPIIAGYAFSMVEAAKAAKLYTLTVSECMWRNDIPTKPLNATGCRVSLTPCRKCGVLRAEVELGLCHFVI